MSHVLALMTRPRTGPYRPTEGAMLWWFRVINAEIFNDELPDIVPRVRSVPGEWASYDAPHIICCDARFHTKQQFVAVLAHETVHHWQAHNGYGNCAHGDSFLRWRRAFRKHGIKLAVHGEVHCAR